MPERRAKWALAVLFVVFAASLLFGAWKGFPVYDDAFVVLFVREGAVARLAENHAMRPAFGFLLQRLVERVGQARGPYVLIGFASWALLAWQIARLWRRLCPDEPDLGFLPAALALAPILVETQYTTVTTALPTNVPVSLVLAALLVALNPRIGSRASPVLSAILVLVAVLVSEYGLVTGAAAIALLLVFRRFRQAGTLAAGVVCGYIVFRFASRLEIRPDVVPSSLLAEAWHQPGSLVTSWISGIWYSLAGAWLSSAGRLWIGSGSRSTLLAAAAGVACAVCAVFLRSRARWRPEERPLAHPFLALAAAVAVGLLPIVLALRSTVATAYGSRFRTAILPFAVIAVVFASERLTRRRFRPAVFGVLAFLAGYRVVDGAFDTVRQQRLLEGLGARLLPLVESSAGITAAVLPGQGSADSADLTPKVTLRWNDDEARRAWVMSPDEATDLFGPRTACHGTTRIEAPPRLESTGRSGPLSHLAWVPVNDRGLGDLETYCLGPP